MRRPNRIVRRWFQPMLARQSRRCSAIIQPPHPPHRKAAAVNVSDARALPTCHMWMDKEGNIICPKKNNASVKAAADAAYSKFAKEAKKRRAKRAEKDSADFELMSEANREKVWKQVNMADVASVASSITSPLLFI